MGKKTGKPRGRTPGFRPRVKANQKLAQRIADETKPDGKIIPGFVLVDGELKRVSGKGGGETPLEYMLRVMNDVEEYDERRDRMADSASPYVHPKLQNIGVKPGGADTPMKDADGNPIIGGKGVITVTMKFDGADDKEIK